MFFGRQSNGCFWETFPVVCLEPASSAIFSFSFSFYFFCILRIVRVLPHFFVLFVVAKRTAVPCTRMRFSVRNNGTVVTSLKYNGWSVRTLWEKKIIAASIHRLWMWQWAFLVVRPQLSSPNPNFSKTRIWAANLDFWSRLTHQLLGRLRFTISNLQIYLPKKANFEKLGLGLDNPYRIVFFLSLRMNKCLRGFDDRHFWNPGVFSYAMIPRCRPNSRAFFIVTSIVYASIARVRKRSIEVPHTARESQVEEPKFTAAWRVFQRPSSSSSVTKRCFHYNLTSSQLRNKKYNIIQLKEKKRLLLLRRF